LAAAVDLEVRKWIYHAIHVTQRSGKIEHDVLILDQVVHAVLVADVGDVHGQLLLKPIDIE
jgi:hypothetical protein